MIYDQQRSRLCSCSCFRFLLHRSLQSSLFPSFFPSPLSPTLSSPPPVLFSTTVTSYSLAQGCSTVAAYCGTLLAHSPSSKMFILQRGVRTRPQILHLQLSDSAPHIILLSPQRVIVLFYLLFDS